MACLPIIAESIFYLTHADKFCELCYTSRMMARAGILLTIELGGMSVISASSLSDILIFVAGLLFLAGLTAVLLRWNRHARPDPFV